MSRVTLTLASTVCTVVLGVGLVVIAWKAQLSKQAGEKGVRNLVTTVQEPLTEEIVNRFLETYPIFRKAATQQPLPGAQTPGPIELLQARRRVLKLTEEVLARQGWLPEAFYFANQRIYYSLMLLDGRKLPDDVVPPLSATVELVRTHRLQLRELRITSP